ncbi:adenine deaminase [Clostridium folliculivorans]|uniref:Adenine deaminase n=1 Tax=Clostridium folliculivorans TaxID=2886038 RepID=A0A9W5Y6F2_9CLOT|nr:adenine deaminase [Clostridium folliculivorans]GKU27410.1 adenine deaminase [Clostridium folliculivorans]
MKMDMNFLKRRIKVASKQIKADCVVKNGKIVNVFTGNITEGDIAIVDGFIAGIGHYEGNEIIDAEGKFIVPGFIDGHMHIESTMLTPHELSKVLIQHGVTTVMADPHEIANVAGTDGINFMLNASEELPLDIFIMLPSCVPATSFGSSGAILNSEDLNPFYSHPRVLGLAEVMDFPSIVNLNEGVLKKIADAHSNRSIIDGHAAGLSREELNIYVAAGIYADHECVNLEEAKDRLELGMYLMIREGTAAKELKKLLPVITPINSRRCILVTDDKLPDDLITEGSVDHNVRLAIKEGLDPVTAIQMVTINAAEFFGLRSFGAVAPGYQADLLILNDLKSISIDKVIKKGKSVVDSGKINKVAFKAEDISKALALKLPKINMKELKGNALEIPLSSELCNVIEIVPNSLITYHRVEKVDIDKGMFAPSISKDQLKMAVIERHHSTGNIGLGIVKGFGIKNGAIATTVAHDSHNIVVVGTSDEEMFLAVNRLIEMGGGIAVASGKEVIASLPLAIGGLMSENSYLEVQEQLHTLNQSLSVIGAYKDFNPFLTLSFLTLPVIPEIKLTDAGLFEFKTFSHIQVQA